MRPLANKVQKEKYKKYIGDSIFKIKNTVLHGSEEKHGLSNKQVKK